MGLTFEWDMRKTGSNVRKHGVSFEDAATVFGDPLTVTIRDPAVPRGEMRFITIGQSLSGRTLVIVHLDDDDTIRIISAREATKNEKRTYEEG